jgi:hypothetical protein
MKNYGLMLTVVGFIFIVINAVEYIFGWLKVHDSLFIFGLVFVAVGMTMVKKS